MESEVGYTVPLTMLLEVGGVAVDVDSVAVLDEQYRVGEGGGYASAARWSCD